MSQANEDTPAHIAWAAAIVFCVVAISASFAAVKIFGDTVILDCAGHEEEMLEIQLRCQEGSSLPAVRESCMDDARESLCKPVKL